MDPTAARVDQLLQRAELLIDQDRYDLARRECEQALALDPHHPYAHSLLAICLMNLGDPRAAHELARRIIELAPHLAEGYLRHAWTILRDPDYVGAAAGWRFDLTADPERRRHLAAKRLLDEAVRIDPHRAFAWNLLSHTLRKLDDPAGALDAADRGLAVAPRDPDLLERRAVALIALGRTLEATAATRQALAIDPQHVTSLHRLGQLLMSEGRYHGALEALVAAVRRDPANAELRADLFDAMQTQGRFFRLAYRVHSLVRPTGSLSLRNFAGIIVVLFAVMAAVAAAAGDRFSSSPWMALLPLVLLLVLVTPLVLFWLGHFSRFVLTFHHEARHLLPVTSRVGSHFVTFFFPALLAMPVGVVLKSGAIPLLVIIPTLPLATATAQISRVARAAFLAYALILIAALSGVIKSGIVPERDAPGWVMVAVAAAFAPLGVVALLDHRGKLP